MSYTRRTSSIDWLSNEESNNANSFRSASNKYAKRMEEDDDELDRNLQRTASHIMAIRKASEENQKACGAACAAEKPEDVQAKETLFEDETQNSVARTAKRTKADFGPCKIHVGNEVNGGDPSVSLALKKIVAHLDRIASYCEANGEKELAKQIDMISNTIEKEDNDNQ